MANTNFLLYSVGSFVLSTAVVWNSWTTRQQFYSMCLHLATSKACMLALGNTALLIFIYFGKLFQRVFLGNLRDVEVEHLTERIVSTIMDTLLIMTIFREEFNSKFISLFVILLFAKVFHWLSHDRVDYLQQTPDVSRMTHMRLVALMSILLTIDIGFIYYAVKVTVSLRAPSMMILFGFEYLLLSSLLVCTCIKYLLNMYDAISTQRAIMTGSVQSWENKGAYLLYLEFFNDAFRLVIYMFFFGIILTYYGIPLHIIRQLYVTFASFKKRVSEVVRYRRATANMNSRYPNATPEELAAAETCIVCLGNMVEAKKLPCGHILHLGCLRSWLERRQECPICRTSVFQEEISQRQNQQIHRAPPNQIPQMPNFGQPPMQQFIQPMQPLQPLEPGTQTPSPMNLGTSQDRSVQKIELIEHQIQIMNQQLKELQHLVSQLKTELPSASKTSEDELLQQAISESLKMSEEANSQEFSDSNERDEIRKRRLMRFSQQLDNVQ